MPRKSSRSASEVVGDYRHEEARRKNNPPSGIAPTYEIKRHERTKYSHDPHLDPQLVWAGKAERTSFDVDAVSLHVHERVSSRAILEAVKRPTPIQLDFFAEPELPLDKLVQFYQHDVDWANRLILGDNLLVMNSLLVREGMAGKVQMIYVDPPYGIRYASNFQPRIDRRDVKDTDEDLTHEPEQIKAYRDTWELGIHSYLTYLWDRLFLCRELLHESGSIFVQINDENLHLVRCLLDEVFGRQNFVCLIAFSKTTGFSGRYLSSVSDYILWYARDITQTKYHPLYREKVPGDEGATKYRPASSFHAIPEGRFEPDRPATLDQLTSQGEVLGSPQEFEFQGRTWMPRRGLHWKTTIQGLRRLAEAERIVVEGESLRYVRFLDDYPVFTLSNVWPDVGGIQSRTEGKLYAVQTATLAVERCILMTTDPGDLVFDPTCGSGTTAYCAEKWGRRWITCDTSRVAIAIARQRLMTAKFDYYELRDSERGPSGGFIYESVPHITLESIAKNAEIDSIATKYEPDIDAALALLNEILGQTWREWEAPREASPGWSPDAREAHQMFWELKRRKRGEIDESIKRNAPQEELYDRPRVKRGVVRVSGPFTVEAIPVPVVEDPTQVSAAHIGEEERSRVSDPAGDHIANMLNLLRKQGGVLFPGGKRLELHNLRVLNLGMLHAEGEAKQNGNTLRVALSFGPQYGPVTASQVYEAIPAARVNGYDMLIFAGFSFDPEAHALLQRVPVGGLQIQFAHIAPDVLCGDLLKTTRASQVLSVFGQPDVVVRRTQDDTFTVELRGVDIYDPLTGEVESTRGSNVAAWFLDTDYDGMTFHICQAFFPGDPDAWEKLQRALKATIDPEAFEKMRGTTSFPFKPGKHMRVAVKVIDFRGNEVVRVLPLQPGT